MRRHFAHRTAVSVHQYPFRGVWSATLGTSVVEPCYATNHHGKDAGWRMHSPGHGDGWRNSGDLHAKQYALHGRRTHHVVAPAGANSTPKLSQAELSGRLCGITGSSSGGG